MKLGLVFCVCTVVHEAATARVSERYSMLAFREYSTPAVLVFWQRYAEKIGLKKKKKKCQLSMSNK